MTTRKMDKLNEELLDAAEEASTMWSKRNFGIGDPESLAVFNRLSRAINAVENERYKMKLVLGL